MTRNFPQWFFQQIRPACVQNHYVVYDYAIHPEKSKNSFDYVQGLYFGPTQIEIVILLPLLEDFLLVLGCVP